MKKIAYLLIGVSALFSIHSCDTLDIDNIYNYDADLVWNDEKLVNAYMANLYGNIFGNWNLYEDQKNQQLIGIAFYPDRITISNGEFKLWEYSKIRLINEALQKVETGNLSSGFKNEIIAQALFLRAYVYFKMVYYHGGVPYLTVPQDKDEDDLYVKRNTTKECFNFMIQDLDKAIALLPERINSTSGDYGKIDACFATAFKAKVLLYKASPQFNPNNPWNNAYWQEAYTANEQAYNKLKGLGYALTADVGDIFTVERGPEVVFSVINAYPNKTTNWERVRPGSESNNEALVTPSWDIIKDFLMLDGKRYNDPTSKYYMTDEAFLQNYWKNRDKRFENSIVWNGGLYEVAGKTGNRQYTSLGVAADLDNFGVNPSAGINSANLDRYSGFFVRKGSDLSLKQSEIMQYDLDYIIMRFAEVMLNYAETANETGKTDIAISLLKEIRQRAGIEPGVDGNYGISTTNREDVRELILAERNIEFCFEGHQFWDLRRLRMLDRLDNKTKYGVEAIAINPDGTEMPIGEAKAKAERNELTEKDFVYSLLQVPQTGVKINTLPDTYYFFPIQQGVIDKNPNLEQNSNWGGTFNPALD
ncbi:MULTISPECIES: RagB/SusD family nutrient uptake outer membrane protein [unclassified Parabacteroides]|uniref:RagB/SusD family nutrient uptake outer membrane protein n=1 Tax=unclassified Parabacteroides TaxID=2649774 RepID=UPI002474D664|nr:MULTISPECIES: RagB/SusD family nutrient uptake outer membrane protein [unclassified Parabacteroides]